MPKRTLVGPYRPRIEPTPEDIQLIEKWASQGSGLLQIARALGISKDLIDAWRDRHPAVSQALEIGREVEHTALLSKTMELALGGNLMALMFLLNCRHGYRDGETQIGNRVSITFTLPGALKPEQYDGTSAPAH